MKYVILLLYVLFFVQAEAKRLRCAVPEALYHDIDTLFKEKITYTKLQVKVIAYPDNKKALLAVKEGKSKFAVVRSDILWRLHEHRLRWEGFSESYITIATLPYQSHLYLVQDKEHGDINIDSLNKKQVSVGSIGEANGYLLKSILALNHMRYQIAYKSIPLKTSMKAIKFNELDAFFGFLPSMLESTNFHFQTLFSDQTTRYLESQEIYTVDYNGIHLPYILVAANDVTDEEIENVIYRLEERGIFTPQTDEQYGEMNLYLLQHLEQVKLALDARAPIITPSKNSYIPHVLSEACLSYHYGFLDLLRRKPRLKKKVWRLGNKKARSYLREIEQILLAIDRKKHTCDHRFLEEKTAAFKSIEQNIHILGR